MKKSILLAIIISGCAAQQKTPVINGDADKLSGTDQLLVDGYNLLTQGDRKKAIGYFDKAVEQCKGEYESQEKQVYASRGTAETVFYMLKAAADKKDAVAVASTCADALYLKGYASLDSGQIEIAEEYMKRAVAMSPVNSMYLSELGHIYHMKLDWVRALEVFRQSEQYAETYSPPQLKKRELGRAKRGVGYSLIELGKPDEAEVKFKECLELDSQDEIALNELLYIKQLRNAVRQ